MSDRRSEIEEELRPKTDIPRAVRRSFINWVVPTLCLALIMACFLVVQNWADGRYTTRVTMDAKTSELMKSIDSEDKKRQDLEHTVESVDRKLDLIIYIMQRDGKVDPQMLPKKTGP